MIPFGDLTIRTASRDEERFVGEPKRLEHLVMRPGGLVGPRLRSSPMHIRRCSKTIAYVLPLCDEDENMKHSAMKRVDGILGGMHLTHGVSVLTIGRTFRQRTQLLLFVGDDTSLSKRSGRVQ